MLEMNKGAVLQVASWFLEGFFGFDISEVAFMSNIFF